MAQLDHGGRTDRPAPETGPVPAARLSEPVPSGRPINGTHVHPLPRARRGVPWLALAGVLALAALIWWLLAASGDEVVRIEALDEGTVAATAAD